MIKEIKNNTIVLKSGSIITRSELQKLLLELATNFDLLKQVSTSKRDNDLHRDSSDLLRASTVFE